MKWGWRGTFNSNETLDSRCARELASINLDGTAVPEVLILHSSAVGPEAAGALVQFGQ